MYSIINLRIKEHKIAVIINPKTDCISINKGNTDPHTIAKIIGSNNIAPSVLNINFGNIFCLTQKGEW